MFWCSTAQTIVDQQTAIDHTMDDFSTITVTANLCAPTGGPGRWIERKSAREIAATDKLCALPSCCCQRIGNGGWRKPGVWRGHYSRGRL
uniref:Uncharacterized protein n=1 Tax=Ditylenchus dipsaci TaxID=166011 RepID=A0A915E3V1_9BILA